MRSVQPLFRFARFTRFVASAAMSIVLTGCLATVPVTHKSNIGLTKKTLQSLIGSDEGTVVQAAGQEPTYRLKDGPSTHLVYAGSYEEGAITVMFTPWPVPLPIPLEKYGGTDCLLLEFDNGQFERYEFADWDYSVALDCRGVFWTEHEFQKILRATAESGDTSAQFEYHYIAPDTEATKWLCLAANNGHQRAQIALGRLHEYGLKGVEKDTVRAYFWYNLPEAKESWKKYAWKSDPEILAERMLPEEIAEAERLVAEWEPNPAMCESFAVPAEN